jgi:hypothetical protein
MKKEREREESSDPSPKYLPLEFWQWRMDQQKEQARGKINNMWCYNSSHGSSGM